ncbi:MAG TPA: sensor histidine kinase [Longimicrobiaceae bacterium]|nr:sensor histidine kinase [Longimicrobiaceae bacterium]
MRLADFLVANREPILAEWEAFARTCTPASGPMDIMALRDHAAAMLNVIAADLRTPQGDAAQEEKSKGNAPEEVETEPTAAEEHGSGRAESGFTVEQMISEYRALRASVVRLWTREQGRIEAEDLEDLTRFHEAIDQSLAESISQYTEDLDRSKEMFLAILGHDLRSPLGSVLTSAQFMLETQNLPEPSLSLTAGIARSSTRMVHMVGALLDFTRSRLGGGIPIEPAPMSMTRTARSVAAEIGAAQPERAIRVLGRGEQMGEWDCARITQVLTNLVGNALEHGSPRARVTIRVGGSDSEVTVAVHNRGPAIPPEQVSGIFQAMKVGSTSGSRTSVGPAGNLGLGLYIADRIVSAHAGTIDVRSTAKEGTTFTVHLPRSRRAPEPAPAAPAGA